ncbi:thioredoxin family protein [bacterium]|nr:thioredoxin family protein [bacterium]
MRRLQVLGLVLIAAVLGFGAGWRIWGTPGEHTAPATANADCVCTCELPSSRAQARSGAPAPRIPTGSGRACLVEFDARESSEGDRMQGVLDQLEPQLAGRLDVVRVDTGLYPGQAQRFRLRRVPTQVLVDATGKELWRHEGYLSLEELQAVSRPHLKTTRKGPAGS